MIPTSVTTEEQEDWGLSDSHKQLLDDLLQKIAALEARIEQLEAV